ncbi:plasmid pRiA4b ORF-3 family protein [Pilimelia columellifera]|uniref:Plasmid pRiA4b Orf3-like domain-containing protein n=1 Tax=Pilimelia columellifera subsp. columellifera TaxID=706583 RepID=A0ABN3NP92_9ACTN
MTRHIYALRIELSDVTPPVWRRVLVPAGYTLDRVHRVIQYAVGWQDCHLHSFDIDGVTYGAPDPDGLLDAADELDHRLDAVAGKDTRFGYTYDFGDWWEHEITVEDVVAADPAQRYPVCVDGAGQCPPEDIGGASGYAEFVAAVADPAHPRHAELREWVGDHEPPSFDPSRVTTLLRRLT